MWFHILFPIHIITNKFYLFYHKKKQYATERVQAILICKLCINIYSYIFDNCNIYSDAIVLSLYVVGSVNTDSF